VAEAKADDFDICVLPGGFGPDKLRTDEGVKRLVRQMHEQVRDAVVPGRTFEEMQRTLTWEKQADEALSQLGFLPASIVNGHD
jgi:enhancing lycopene biosynthesis protein 2